MKVYQINKKDGLSNQFIVLVTLIVGFLIITLIAPVFVGRIASAQLDGDYLPIPDDGITESGDYAGTLVSDELEREFLIHVPDDYDPETAVPLVITFHGFNEGAERHAASSEFIGLSDDEGFVVVIPQGRGSNPSWRVSAAANRRSRSDTQFARDLIQFMQAHLNIDSDRIYITGFSMGGGLANRIACDLSEVVAAVAPVAGAYQPDDECEPQQSVPMITLHGLVDNTTPFNGGDNRPHVGDLYEVWAGWNECTAEPVDAALDDGVNAQTWMECRNNATVTVITYDDLGHFFPEGGAALIWEFFEEHSRSDIEDDMDDAVDSESDEDDEDIEEGVG